MRGVIYFLVDKVDDFLTGHEVPDAVTGENHPAVVFWINLVGSDVGLGRDHLFRQTQGFVLLVGMVTYSYNCFETLTGIIC